MSIWRNRASALILVLGTLPPSFIGINHVAGQPEIPRPSRSFESPETRARLGSPTAVPALSPPVPPSVRAEEQPPDIGRAFSKETEDYLARALPINLLTALRLAQANNLDIAQGRQVVDQTQAALTRARVLMLPNLNLGSTYSHHDGNISKTEGNIIKANKESLFVGGGPSLTLGLSDALFGPPVARQLRSASRASLQRIANETTFAVAEAYFGVLRARRRLARVDEVLDHLASTRPSPARADSKGLLPLVQGFLKVGGAEALKAEVDRVEVEVLRRREEREAALQDLRLSGAELANLIRLDLLVTLLPMEDFRFPLALPGEPWYSQPVEELIRMAFMNRPELAENEALVQAAIERVRAARFRPMLPNLALTYNFGGYGGGPDLLSAVVGGKTVTFFGPSGAIRHFNTRDDFDISVFWRLQNMGLGDLAAVREQQALRRQAQLRQQQVQDRVALDVIQSLERVQSLRQRVATVGQALFDDQGNAKGPAFRAVRLNFERIRNVPGSRPLEVLDSIRGLNDLLEAYGQAVTEYERSRFRLIVALGVPAHELIGQLETLLRP
jgi:outer membrane protein TolC